ncbi:hypothetical protein [Rhodoblastus sp.]|uniref:hypothetical protein n=1 Tax=Rhodoblastus sp. TaxID=1962975 RepID=UPI003F951202
MTAAKTKPADDLRMSAEEFDRIMGKALQVKPEGTLKATPPSKTKASAPKRRAKKSVDSA